MKAWYLLQTKPRHEHLAKINLERQGFGIYMPVIPIRRRRRDKTVREPGPMFPSYLFISLREGIDNWAPIRSTKGVSKLVRFGQIAARVPDRLIEALKGREDSNGVQILPDTQFRRGEPVRISDGPFEGYEAIVYAHTAGERIVLLLKIVESYVKVELNSANLERLV